MPEPPAARAALLAPLLLAPVLLAQALRVRRVTPRLPEAQGPRAGLRRPAGDRGAPALRLLIAGDSSAAGVGADTQDRALAGRLSRALVARTSRAVRWRVVARSGLDARGLTRLLGEGEIEEFDVAVVAVGVNDVTAFRRLPAWLRELDRLRALLLARSPAALVVASGLPPMHRFPALPEPLRSFLGARARTFDTALARWAASKPGAVHVPLPDLDGPGLAASDGFHPGPAAYERWADTLADAIARTTRAA